MVTLRSVEDSEDVTSSRIQVAPSLAFAGQPAYARFDAAAYVAHAALLDHEDATASDSDDDLFAAEDAFDTLLPRLPPSKAAEENPLCSEDSAKGERFGSKYSLDSSESLDSFGNFSSLNSNTPAQRQGSLRGDKENHEEQRGAPVLNQHVNSGTSRRPCKTSKELSVAARTVSTAIQSQRTLRMETTRARKKPGQESGARNERVKRLVDSWIVENQSASVQKEDGVEAPPGDDEECAGCTVS